MANFWTLFLLFTGCCLGLPSLPLEAQTSDSIQHCRQSLKPHSIEVDIETMQGQFSDPKSLRQLNTIDAAKIKAQLIEFYTPAIYAKTPLLRPFPFAAKDLFARAFAFYRDNGELQFLDELMSAYFTFRLSQGSNEDIVGELIESIEFEWPSNVSFPATAYEKQLPPSALVMVTKFKPPLDVTVVDILISVSKVDTYWKSAILKELSDVSAHRSDRKLPLVGLTDRERNHSDEYKYFQLSPNSFFIGHRSANWPTGSRSSLSALLFYLSQKIRTKTISSASAKPSALL